MRIQNYILIIASKLETTFAVLIVQTVIYLSIKESISFTYGNALLSLVKSKFPAAVVYDADSHSDPITMGYAIDLLNQSTQCLLIIEALEAPLGSLRSLLEKVIEQKTKCRIVFNGTNAVTERMLNLLPTSQVKKDLTVSAQQEAIVEWLS